MFGEEDYGDQGEQQQAAAADALSSPTSGAAGPPPAAAPSAGSPPAAPEAAAPASASGAAAPTAAATPAPVQQPDTHKNFGQKMLSGILGALGGTTEVQYQRDPQTGKMIATHVKSGPGQQWKRIIAGGLVGASAGMAQHGPGSKGRAAAAGFGAGYDLRDKEDKQKYDRANDDFEAQQKATVSRAQVAMTNQQLSESAFRLTRMQIEGSFNDAARENEFVKAITEGGPSSRDLGVFTSPDELYKHVNDNPQLAQAQAQGRIISTPHVVDGKYMGMRYAMVEPDWFGQKLQSDRTFYHLVPPTKSGAEPTVEMQTVKAGTMSNGDFEKARMASEKEILDWDEKKMVRKSAEKIAAGNNATSITVAKIGATSRENVAQTNARSKFSGLTTATRTMAEKAPGVIDLANKMEEKVRAQVDSLGPAAGRWNEFWTGKVGSPNPEFAALLADKKLAGTLLANMHIGSRGSNYLVAQFQQMLDTAQSPENLISVLEEIKNYANDKVGQARAAGYDIPDVGGGAAAAGAGAGAGAGEKEVRDASGNVIGYTSDGKTMRPVTPK